METINMVLTEAGVWALDMAEKGLNALIPSANAAIDTEAVATSLTAAQASGEEVGELVVGVVAALVVVGIIITMVKKL
jgi:hypothetical protein